MNWPALRSNKCPKCGKALVKKETSKGLMLKCPSFPPDCDFIISEDRSAQINYNMDHGISNSGKRNFEEGYGE